MNICGVILVLLSRNGGDGRELCCLSSKQRVCVNQSLQLEELINGDEAGQTQDVRPPERAADTEAEEESLLAEVVNGHKKAIWKPEMK